jgi:thioredoxin 1
MKKSNLFLIVFLMGSMVAFSQKTTTKAAIAAQPIGIVFTDGSWAKILEKAKKENKLIFFDAYTSWCGPCKNLQKTVFTRKDVGDFYNKNFINVKRDMEEGEGPALAERYPIDGYPTLFFIDGNGKIVQKQLGALKPDQFIALGKSVAK